MRFPSPPSSAPSALRPVVVPVTGDGEAAAGMANTGAPLMIVIEADPEIAPTSARMLADPATAGEVYRPAASIDPMPDVFVHVKAGCATIGWPNWSYAVALNCCVAFSLSVAAP